MNITLLVPPAVGFVLNIILTPIIIRVAHRNRWYDEKNHRKIHTEDTPRLGGVGIFIGTIAAIVVAALVWPTGRGSLPLPLASDASGAQILLYLLPILAGALIVHVLGLVDDFVNLRARSKFLIQIVAAIVVTLGPFRIERLTIPFVWYDLELGIFAYPVTVLWVVGVSNALNFVDGVDGLAGGIAAIAAVFFSVIAILTGQALVAMIMLGIVGSVLAFLAFNAPPARIFMGDSGAYALGYLLAVFPLMLSSGTGDSLDLIPAVTILAVPVIDTVTSAIRRLSRGKHPFSADREHLHHKLLDAGFGTWKLIATLYVTAFGFGLSAVAWYLVPVNVDVGIVLAAWVVGLAVVMRLAKPANE